MYVGGIGIHRLVLGSWLVSYCMMVCILILATICVREREREGERERGGMLA